MNNTHILDHLSNLRLLPFPYTFFPCDIHRTQGAAGMNTAWAFAYRQDNFYFQYLTW